MITHSIGFSLIILRDVGANTITEHNVIVYYGCRARARDSAAGHALQLRLLRSEQQQQRSRDQPRSGAHLLEPGRQTGVRAEVHTGGEPEHLSTGT